MSSRTDSLTDWQKWIFQQDRSFVNEICGLNIPQHKYIDFNYREISLKDLMELDQKYIDDVDL